MAPADPLWKRLAWMGIIWAGSVMTLIAVSLLIKLWLAP